MSSGSPKKKLAVNHAEAEIIRLIYRWYVEGLGAKAIAERLNREGHGYRGKLWSKNRVLDIIGDEAYIGHYFFNRTDSKTHRLKPREEWIEIPIEPIVDEGVWQRAKVLKADRTPADSARNPAVVGSKTLLTGLAICGKCGARMSLETGKGGRFTYYNCSNYLRRGKSTGPGQRIRSAELERAILDHMASKLFTTERVREILRGVYTELRNMEKGREGQRKSLQRQLDLIQGKLTKQYEAIESGAVGLADVGERIRDLKGQRGAIEAKITEIKTGSAIPLHIFQDESIARFQSMVKDMFLSEDRLAAKAYLKLFIEKIVINLPRIDISCKTEVLLAALDNKSAVRTSDILTADMNWLLSTDSNHGPAG